MAKQTVWDLALNISGKGTEASQAIRTVKKQLDDLKAAANQVGKDWKAFTGNATKLALGVAGGVAAATAGVVSMANSFAAAGDKAAKTSAALGIGVEAYQELSYAMGQSGLSAQEFDTALQKFNLTVRQGAAGNEAMRKQLLAVGLSAEKLAGMKPEQAMERLSDYMKSLPNDAKRTQVAVTLFGKTAGPKMMAAMKQGSEGLRQLSREARDLGIIISDEQAKQSEAYGDSLDRLKQSVTGFKNQFIGGAIGPLTEAFDHLKDAIVEQMPAISELGKNFGLWLGETVKRLPEIIAKIKEFGFWVKDTVTGVKDLVGGWENLAKILAGLAIAPTLFSGMKVLWSLAKLIKVAIAAMPLILVKLKVVFAAIAGAAAPIVVIMAGIALAIYTVIRNFDKLKAYAMQCFERIKAAFGVSSESADKFTAVLETAKKALGIVMGILEGGMLFAIKTVMNAITSAIQMVIGAIMIWVNVAKLGLWPIITIIKVIIGLFTGGLPGALDALEGQFAKLGEIFSGIFGGFKVILGGVIGLFTGLFKDGIEFVKNIFGLFGADVAGIFNTAKEAIKSAFTGVIDWVKTNWKSIALFIINPFAGVFKYLYDNFEGFRNVVNNVVSAIKGFFEKGIDFIKNIIGGLPEPFQNVFTGIKIIIDGFIGFWKNAFSAGSNAIEAIVNLLPNLFSDPIGTIKAIIGEAVTFFKTVFQGGIDAVKGIIDGFADRFGGVFVSIKEKIGGFVNFFKDRMEPVKDFFSGIGEKIGGLFGKGKAADIAAHAGGGIFTHRHIAEIAEKGAEAVVPLNKSPQGFDIWKRAGELGGYLKKASEQSPAISAATPPAKPPEPSPVMAAAAQRISSGDTVVNVEFRMTNNFNGGTPDGETAKRISEAGQQAADDFETRVKIAIENIMNNQRRTSFA